MNRYLKLAVIGFAACCPLCYVLLMVLDVWPTWENQQVLITCVYFILSGAYVVSCSAFLSDLFSGQGEWHSLPTQYFDASLVGASLGLFLLSWTAILSVNGLDFLYTGQFQHFLQGAGPEALWLQARDLVPKAELLGACKTIVENCGQYASIFAALTIANCWICNMLNRRGIVFFGLRFLIPSLIIMRIFFLSNPWDFMLLGPMFGLAVLFVCFVDLTTIPGSVKR